MNEFSVNLLTSYNCVIKDYMTEENCNLGGYTSKLQTKNMV